MRIINIDLNPLEKYPYWVVQTGGRDINGNRVIEKVNLQILKGSFNDLGKDIDAIIATSDLQGIVKSDDREYLLGQKLPEFLSMLIEIEFPNLAKNRIGVILCGDLYANIEKRGGFGDVKEVWRAFNKHFKWVIGVTGNHDDFGNSNEFENFKKEKNIHYLHNQVKEIDKIKFGGIGGIIGRNDKPNRIEEKEYLKILKELLLKQPNVILIHQSPDNIDAIKQGNEEIRKVIESSPPNLIFCGHSHWDKPLATLENGSQIVNVEGRVVVLINNL